MKTCRRSGFTVIAFMAISLIPLRYPASAAEPLSSILLPAWSGQTFTALRISGRKLVYTVRIPAQSASGSGQFTARVDGLSPGEVRYARAYMIYKIGGAYKVVYSNTVVGTV